MQNQKENQALEQRPVLQSNNWVSQYTKPNQLPNWQIQENTPLLQKLKKSNPSMQINVVHHNGIFAVVVHYENHCFFDCDSFLPEADCAIALGILESKKQFIKFKEPKDFF